MPLSKEMGTIPIKDPLNLFVLLYFITVCHIYRKMQHFVRKFRTILKYMCLLNSRMNTFLFFRYFAFMQKKNVFSKKLCFNVRKASFHISVFIYQNKRFDSQRGPKKKYPFFILENSVM